MRISIQTESHATRGITAEQNIRGFRPISAAISACRNWKLCPRLLASPRLRADYAQLGRYLVEIADDVPCRAVGSEILGYVLIPVSWPRSSGVTVARLVTPLRMNTRARAIRISASPIV